MKITSVLVVREIEPSLAFWVDRMGFTKTAEVAEGDRLGFVILERDGARLMMQSSASVQKEVPQFGSERGHAHLFTEVADFEDTLRRLYGYPITLPERTTFYGMREVGVLDPGGHVVIFAFPIHNQA